ncbi:hypothetical protein GWN65_06285 [Candidatus Bathyarchaeota archaeon]|nr:hypothetical protein [Candidatus Bathyarchaeota archaeon]NIV44797.1 hypothetical protein [Candidatus Bathyarchaeota archaeon]
MISVYILGKVGTGDELEVLDTFRDTAQVRKASLTYGTYDLCLETLFETMEELDDFLFNVVRKTPGITDTVTLVAAKTISKDS